MGDVLDRDDDDRQFQAPMKYETLKELIRYTKAINLYPDVFQEVVYKFSNVN